MAKENIEKPNRDETIDPLLQHYQERAAELVNKGLIEQEDEEHVMAEKDPDRAKSLLLSALEKKHKETRDSYLNSASNERQDQIDSGLA